LAQEAPRLKNMLLKRKYVWSLRLVYMC